MINPNQDSRADKFANPIVTFISIIAVGVVIAVFIVDKQELIGPIILLSFVIGAIVAVVEFRVIIRKSKKSLKEKSEDEDKIKQTHQEKLAKYVAGLFDDDLESDEVKTEKMPD